MRPVPATLQHARQAGMSLIEVLIGLVIGMIGVVVIFEALAAFEARRYSTGGGADAQSLGAVAMHELERDLKTAGYGFNLSTLMGCTVNAVDTGRSTPAYTFTLAPVLITQGSSGAPDTISSLWGSGSLMVTTQTFAASTATSKRLQNRAGTLNGDRLIVTGAGPLCAMIEVTGTANTDGVTIDHGTTAYTNASGVVTTPRYNNPSTTFTTGNVYNMGASPRRNVWQIRNFKTLIVTNELVWTDANSDGTNDYQEIGDNVIDLQADYGVDANNNNRIASTEWTTTAPTDYSRVLAIRVAILVRNSQYEKTAITTSAPTWMGGTFTMRNVDGTTDNNPATDNNWRNYRYRVFQTIVPIRNQMWSTAP